MSTARGFQESQSRCLVSKIDTNPLKIVESVMVIPEKRAQNTFNRLKPNEIKPQQIFS